MSEPTPGWAFWQWLLGGAISLLTGAALGGYAARGKLEDLKDDLDGKIEKAAEDLEKKIVEANIESLATRSRVHALEIAQARCQATLREDIQQIVESAINKHLLDSNKELEAIRNKLTVIADRLDRRQSDTFPPPHGERRDQLGVSGIEAL